MPIPALPFAEAIAWLRARVPMSDAQFAALEARARHKAFALAGVTQASLAAEVWRGLERHLEAGFDLPAFQAEFAPVLSRAWGIGEAAAGARLGLVAHNALQSAYNAGRWAQATDGLAPVFYPYLQFVAVRDFRTSPICGALDGITMPVGDGRWAGRVPPCHHRCRSTIVSRRQAWVDQHAATVRPIPKAGIADEGFGEIPTLGTWSAPSVPLPAPIAQAMARKPPPPALPRAS